MTNAEMKPERFATWARHRRALAWITEQVNAGRTVYLSTSLRATKVSAKTLPLIKATKTGLYVKIGTKWIDYSFTKISAQ